MSYRVTVDTGGTFTDLVLADDEQVLGFFKSPTTPEDMFEGVVGALGLAASSRSLSVSQLLGHTSLFVYSTTYGTNAILEEKTAPTAFVTTAGHADMLVYREGGKPDPYDLSTPYPEPYVPQSLTFELSERVLSDGTVMTPLDDAEVLGVAARIAELDVAAVGVCLLWSVVNSDHELRVGELLAERCPNLEITLSHRINPIIREFRRASSAVLDASLKPLMRRHLLDIDQRLRELGYTGEPLSVTHVSGGMRTLREICESPLHSVDSGPALGPIAGRVVATTHTGDERVDAIVTDLGGTSFDISIVREGELTYTREKWLGGEFLGHPTGMHAVDTRSVSAGGGSIAWVDEGGIPHVGPHSAGADPGPVCYGHGGTRPTVTDAAAVLGYLDADYFAQGQFDLDVDGARAAVQRDVGDPLGVATEEASLAILAVATESMRGFIYDMTILQGLDPRSCLLVSGGGAAGLNIIGVARELAVTRVLIPSGAGVFCALGGQYADTARDFSQRLFTKTSTFDFEGVNRMLDQLRAEADNFLARQGGDGTSVVEFTCEARYADQNWEIDVAVPDGRIESEIDLREFEEEFHRMHRTLFAVDQPGQPLECINWRARARLIRPKPGLPTAPATPARKGPARSRRVWHASDWREIPVHHSTELAAGTLIEGPGVIEDPTTTIVVPDGVTARVTDNRSYDIMVGASNA